MGRRKGGERKKRGVAKEKKARKRARKEAWKRGTKKEEKGE